MKYILTVLIIASMAPLVSAQYEPAPSVFPKHTLHIDPGFVWPTDISKAEVSPKALGTLLKQFLYDTDTVENVRFKVVQLDRGLPVIAVHADYDGRTAPFVDLLRCEGVICSGQSVYSMGFDDIGKEFYDFEGNGVQDVIAAQPLDFADPFIAIFRVYRMVNGEMVDITKGNQKAAAKLLSLVEEQKRKCEQAHFEIPDGPDKAERVAWLEERGRTPAIWMEQCEYARDDYDRVVLGRASVGFEHAKKWKQSKTRAIRRLAIEAFEQLASSEALSQLAEMTKSGEQLTAYEAQAAIERVHLRRTGRYLDGRVPLPLDDNDK